MTGTYTVIGRDQFIRQLKQNIDLEHVVLLGAGASQSSGVPTAKECIWKWKEELYKSANANELGVAIRDEANREVIQTWLDKRGMHPAKDDPSEYMHYAENVYLNNEGRRIFFEKLFDGKDPGLGYKILTLFALRGTFKIIMTTNFDGLVTKALQSEGVNVKEITIETASLIHKPMSKKSVYSVALHGDFKYDALKNTGTELDNQSDDFKHALNRHLYNKHLIVSGYSGRDKSLMDALLEAYKEQGGGAIFWCSYSENVLPEVDDLLKKISSLNRDAYLVVSGDFDESFKAMGHFCFNDDKEFSHMLDGFAAFGGVGDGKIVADYVEPVAAENADKTKIESEIEKINLAVYSKTDLDALMLANLLGQWHESEGDLSIVTQLPVDFSVWSESLREMLQAERPLLELLNGKIWIVNFRGFLWESLRSRIFDHHLDKIKTISIEVLGEIDPKFELESDKHYVAGILGKILRYSNNLREGLAETLVWLGMNGDSLTNCPPDKRKYTALLAIREIFADASWQLWGSLNQLLPTLAEAAPGEFLDAVESALGTTPSPFDELFKQEGDGFSGANHLTGLYWALEGLAWDEEYLSRVCVILAELAEHDPGGRWANRPANSITTILLPWHPQTLAPIEKRLAAVRAIRKDSPQTAWKVLLSLLPNSHQSTTGSHKPKWRNPLPEDWKPVVTNGEYRELVIQYAAIAVEMACEDLTKAKELVGNLDNLPEPSFDVFLNYLSSEAIIGLAETERKSIWEKLTEFANKHRRYADAKWALPPALVSRLDVVAELLKPSTSTVLYERLFSTRDFDLYDENGDWQEEEKKLAAKRRNAIEEILAVSGLDAVINFSGKVENSAKVGFSLGSINIEDHDIQLLPSFLDAEDVAQRNFIGNFIWGRYHHQGWAWVDNINKSGWSNDQISQLLVCLPFEQDAWVRATKWLGNDERIYWESANVNPYQTEDDLTPAIDKLLEFGRPVAVVDCLYLRKHKKLPLDIHRSISALMLAISSNESKNTLGYTHITDLISALQEDKQVPFDDMCQIEWLYIALLERDGKTEAKYLHKRLSMQPEFFCEAISLIYRAKGDTKEGVEQDEIKKQIATNAWHLLYGWTRVPGVLDDGGFSAEQFTQWFSDAKKLCESAGRLDVAMLEIGKVLRYAPADPDGLWINRAVLAVLDDRHAEHLREGFVSEVFNSRGAHWVDPTGKPERDLAEEWRQKANAIEMEGCPRFAAELKGLADSYDRDAERVIRERT